MENKKILTGILLGSALLTGCATNSNLEYKLIEPKQQQKADLEKEANRIHCKEFSYDCNSKNVNSRQQLENSANEIYDKNFGDEYQ
jgi:hypothetical protein